MDAATFFVLWDESHLWGLLLARCLRHFGLPHRLVTARSIAEGALRARPAGLLVPGGWARRKAELLGPAGIEEIRAYVLAGGAYIGFCGGAGLGLTGGGLDLCPWTRKGFADRLQHFVSGHIHATLPQRGELVPDGLRDNPLLPVWWPARFDPCPNNAVTVLAAYGEPGPDFMVADIALAGLPEETLDDWQNLYGISLMPRFMAGQPCLVETRPGRGRAILSYAHLETPASAEANIWLAHILETLGGQAIQGSRLVPAWDLESRPTAWNDPLLGRLRHVLAEIIHLGEEHFLLYWRNPWLLGWRRGIPGAALSSLYALVREVQAREPAPAAESYWREAAPPLARDLETFRKGVIGYLLAERLAMTLGSAPDDVRLKEHKQALFGPPPGSAGLYGRLLAPLEGLARLALGGQTP